MVFKNLYIFKLKKNVGIFFFLTMKLALIVSLRIDVNTTFVYVCLQKLTHWNKGNFFFVKSRNKIAKKKVCKKSKPV